MILIADSGSTKTDWCLINQEKNKVYFTTEGYNPFFSAYADIIKSIKDNLPSEIDALKVNEIHFYGAGCQDGKQSVMRQILQEVFSNCETINTEVDLLAAARGLLGNEPGFAAILGTGTNTCLYNGIDIELNIDSLGFILGDEGSGAAIGKRILSDYLRNKMPEAMQVLFFETYQYSEAELIDKIYTEPLPNRFCASFSRFLNHEEIDNHYRSSLIISSFEDFFKNLVSCYPNYTNYVFNCVGSVGYYFKNELLQVMTSYGMTPGRILPSLIKELADYHLTVAPVKI